MRTILRRFAATRLPLNRAGVPLQPLFSLISDKVSARPEAIGTTPVLNNK
jgi:hypothetical protein